MKKEGKLRLLVEASFFAFSNGYLNGWIKGKIYKGPAKKLCLPGLNCYSCPGAFYSCPIGALSSILGRTSYRVSIFILGFLGLMGMLFGRLLCGFVCPFGFIQELLYKIPFFNKRKLMPGHRFLKYLKYVILIVVVIILPLAIVDGSGQGMPVFCKYICPSGTLLGGIPLILRDESLQETVGWTFALKLAVLIVVILMSVICYRWFCKYICPLGAIYSLTNRISLYQMHYDKAKCNGCGQCKEVCDMGVDIREDANALECIRCGRCKDICTKGAITSSCSLWKNGEKKV